MSDRRQETWTAVDDVRRRPAGARTTRRSKRRSPPARRPGCPRSRSRRRRASCSACWRGRSARSTVLEFGTLGGYSTIWLGRALPADGRLITLEADPALRGGGARQHRARRASASWSRSASARRWRRCRQLEDEGAGPFDLVFIDADKVNTPDYFAWSLEHTRPGGADRRRQRRPRRRARRRGRRRPGDPRPAPLPRDARRRAAGRGDDDPDRRRQGLRRLRRSPWSRGAAASRNGARIHLPPRELAPLRRRLRQHAAL